MKNQSNHSDIQESISLRICYNFLEGINLPEEIKKEKRHFCLNKIEQEAQEFCKSFERIFKKRLEYRTKGKESTFFYDSLVIPIQKTCLGYIH